MCKFKVGDIVTGESNCLNYAKLVLRVREVNSDNTFRADILKGKPVLGASKDGLFSDSFFRLVGSTLPKSKSLATEEQESTRFWFLFRGNKTIIKKYVKNTLVDTVIAKCDPQDIFTMKDGMLTGVTRIFEAEELRAEYAKLGKKYPGYKKAKKFKQSESLDSDLMAKLTCEGSVPLSGKIYIDGKEVKGSVDITHIFDNITPKKPKVLQRENRPITPEEFFKSNMGILALLRGDII